MKSRDTSRYVRLFVRASIPISDVGIGLLTLLIAASTAWAQPHASTAQPALLLSPENPVAGEVLYVFLEPASSRDLRVDLWAWPQGEGDLPDAIPQLGSRDDPEAFGAELEASAVLPAARGFVRVDLPFRDATYLVRVVDPSDGDRVVAQGPPIVVTAPSELMGVPAFAYAGETIDVAWDVRTGPGTSLVVERDGAVGLATVLVRIDVAGRQGLLVTLPEEPGRYVLRLERGDGTTLIERWIEVDPDPAAPEVPSDGGCSESPSEATLRRAFQDAVENFLSQARIAYGGDYDLAGYDITVRSADVFRTSGTVEATYRGSALEVDTGRSVEADGTLSAWFEFEGCTWRLDGFSY